MTRIKICGITTPDDARAAAAAGADALGFVLADSPRRVSPAQVAACCAELPPFVLRVGVFMDAAREEIIAALLEAPLDVVQLHGSERPKECRGLARRVIKRFDIRAGDTAAAIAARMAAYRVDGYLLDPGAGSGRVFDWRVAVGIGRPVIVSGGLTPENVGEVVRLLRPHAVDVSSGVESGPGRKDAGRIRAFVEAVRKADADAGTR